MLIFIQLLIGNSGYAQSDTNHLVIDCLELDFLDSNETLEYLKFMSNTDTLIFTDTSKCKMIAINRWKISQLYLKTNKTEFVFKNINIYISFIDTKYRISIQIPENHSNCIDASFLQPDGLEVFHFQTMEHSKNQNGPITCMSIYACPTAYKRSEKYEYQYLLE